MLLCVATRCQRVQENGTVMDQPWWVYLSLLVGCIVFYLISVVVEKKYDRELWFLQMPLGIGALIIAIKLANVINLFS